MTDISASPGRQVPVNQLRPKEPPPMVIQGDFRKVMTLSLDSHTHTHTRTRTWTRARAHTDTYTCGRYSASFLQLQAYGSRDALRIRTLTPTCRHLPRSISKRCRGTRDHFECTIRPRCLYSCLLIISIALKLTLSGIQFNV